MRNRNIVNIKKKKTKSKADIAKLSAQRCKDWIQKWFKSTEFSALPIVLIGVRVDREGKGNPVIEVAEGVSDEYLLQVISALHEQQKEIVSKKRAENDSHKSEIDG